MEVVAGQVQRIAELLFCLLQSAVQDEVFGARTVHIEDVPGQAVRLGERVPDLRVVRVVLGVFHQQRLCFLRFARA